MPVTKVLGFELIKKDESLSYPLFRKSNFNFSFIYVTYDSVSRLKQ